MADKTQITVVLPVYNVVDYLEECIKSVLKQTYVNFELILVDDGSSDGSELICDKYKEMDCRIIVIHQKNGGLSAARNTGISYASGKFITFIDSDDYIAPEYIEKLYEAIIKYDADISMCDFQKVPENSKLSERTILFGKMIKELVLNKEETIKEVYRDTNHGIDFVAWAKMYRLDLFKTNNIYFPVGKLHEDTFTTYKLIFCCDRIIYVDAPMYYYIIRKGSITTSDFSVKRLDMIEATREEYKFFEKKGNYELMEIAFFDYLHKVKFVLKMLNCSSNDTRKFTKKVCKDLENDIEECKKYISIPLIKYVYYKGIAKFPNIFIGTGKKNE